MFAIIDIETCGGKFDFRRGRITEICIVKHDGLSVTEVFTTLINPECHISNYFSGLTGITNEMVANAPKFHEVAKKIITLTENCIFVAHNVSFDYGFIKEEFASLGYAYKRETLCTVRLARKLIPGRISYSLGHLCAALGIEIFGRHRAEGDAVATAELFNRLLALKAIHPQYKNMGVDELMVRRVDKIKSYVLNKLPETCGVYYFLNKDKQIMYIGKSTNMYNRAISHFGTDTKKHKQLLHELTNVDYVETGSELIALLLEADEIKTHQPRFNRMRKNVDVSHTLSWFVSENGALALKISPFDEAEQAILSFATYSSARARLDSWIEEYTLCLTYCGLTSPDAICFNHQIKNCNGICAGEESIETYNERVKKLIDKHAYPHADFLIMDKGRRPDERSVILIEKGKYAGFGYFDQTAQFSHPESLREVIQKRNWHPDADLLVRHFIREKRCKIIPIRPNAFSEYE